MSWKLLLPTFLLFFAACNTQVGKLEMAGYQMNSSMSSSSAPVNGINVNLDFSTNFDVDGDDVPLTWDAFGGDYTEDFQIKLYTDSDCTLGEIDFGTTSSTSLSDNGIIDSLTDGTYYATVTAFNLDGDSITSACSTDTVIIDTIPPVAGSNPLFTNDYSMTGNNLAMTWSAFTDANLANHRIDIHGMMGCGGPVVATFTTNSSSNAATVTLGSNLVDGEYWAMVYGTDAVGQTTTTACSTDSIIVDSTAPTDNTANLQFTYATDSDGDNIDVSWTAFTDPSGSGIANHSIAIIANDPTCNPINQVGFFTTNSPSNSDNTVIDGLADGTYYGYVRSYDAAGNTTNSICSTDFIIVDSAAPTDNTANFQFNDDYDTDGNNLDVQWTAFTDANLSDHRIDIYTTSNCTGMPSNTFNTSSATNSDNTVIDGLADGTYYATVTAIDSAGFETTSACSSDSIVVDSTPPTDIGANPTFLDTYDTDGDNIRIQWIAFTDAGSGIVDYEIDLYSNAICTAPVGNFPTGSTSTTNNTLVDGFSDGTYYATITAIDAAGLSTTSDCSNLNGESIIVDTTPPTISAVAFSSADGTYSNIGDTIDLKITFNEAVTVNTAGGAPRVLMETGNSDDYATYKVSAPGTAVDFEYLVSLGDINPDLDYVATNSLELNGGTITDAAGNSADLTLPAVGTLAGDHDIVIDAYQRVAQVSAGGAHTCILTTKNNVYCVGKNNFGQIGNGTSGADVTTWTQIDTTALAPGDYFTELSAALDVTCGITNNDAAYCWGNNTAGQLGYDNGGAGIEASRNIPSAMDTSNFAGGENFKKLVTTGNTTCVYTNLSNIFCTGNDSNGQLGNNNSVSADQEILVPINTALTTPAGITDIYAGGDRFCASTNNAGTVQVACWGRAANYALGDADLTNNLIPNFQSTPVPGGHLTAVSLSDGTHGCGLSNSGSDIFCWGFNNSGQVGDNSTTDVQEPDSIDTSMLGGENFVKIADTMGMEHSCALTDANNIWCWGRTLAGVLGNGTTVLDPNQVRPTTPVDNSSLDVGETFNGVELGADHTCATTSDDNLLCWGANLNYQLGIGNNLDQSTPQKIDLDDINP